jgi:hypothetical protein
MVNTCLITWTASTRKEFLVSSRRNETLSFSTEDVAKTTTTTTTPAGATHPVATTWEQHWTKLDDGTGRFVSSKLTWGYHFYLLWCASRVPQEKFVEYVTTSDDYKNHLDRAII